MKTGCKRAEVRAWSKVTEDGSPGASRATAVVAASAVSGCMSTKDMPVLDQSVLRNRGRELSYWRRMGSETKSFLREVKVSSSVGVQMDGGIGLR